MVSNRRREEHEENGNRGQTSEESERLTASTMRRGTSQEMGGTVDPRTWKSQMMEQNSWGQLLSPVHPGRSPASILVALLPFPICQLQGP